MPRAGPGEFAPAWLACARRRGHDGRPERPRRWRAAGRARRELRRRAGRAAPTHDDAWASDGGERPRAGEPCRRQLGGAERVPPPPLPYLSPLFFPTRPALLLPPPPSPSPAVEDARGGPRIQPAWPWRRSDPAREASLPDAPARARDLSLCTPPEDRLELEHRHCPCTPASAPHRWISRRCPPPLLSLLPQRGRLPLSGAPPSTAAACGGAARPGAGRAFAAAPGRPARRGPGCSALLERSALSGAPPRRLRRRSLAQAAVPSPRLPRPGASSFLRRPRRPRWSRASASRRWWQRWSPGRRRRPVLWRGRARAKRERARRDDAEPGARHGAGAPLAGGWGRGGPHLSVGRREPYGRARRTALACRLTEQSRRSRQGHTKDAR